MSNMQMKFKPVFSVNFRQEVNAMGVPTAHLTTGYNIDSFPMVVNQIYKPIWEQYIASDIAAQLSAIGKNSVESHYYVCSGFISHVCNNVSQPFTGRAYDPAKGSMQRLDKLLQQYQSAWSDWFKRKNLTRKLGVSDITVRIKDYETQEFCNAALNLELELTYILKPYKTYVLSKGAIGTSVKKAPLDMVLEDVGKYLIGSSKIPNKLAGAKRNLSKGRTHTRYPKREVVSRLPDRFLFLVDKSLGVPVYMIRSGKYEMLTRVSFTLPIVFFLGNSKIEVLQKAITAFLKRGNT